RVLGIRSHAPHHSVVQPGAIPLIWVSRRTSSHRRCDLDSCRGRRAAPASPHRTRSLASVSHRLGVRADPNVKNEAKGVTFTRCEVRRCGLDTMTLVVDLARPYRASLAVILAAMLVETLASLASPWPLKVVIDYAVGHRNMPAWSVAWLGPAAASDAR